MRAVIQRVTSASVTVDGKIVGQIGKGLMVLIGIGRQDVDDDIAWISRKILSARLFDSVDGKKYWAESVTSLGLEVLLVSQFTLHASLKKPKPDFHRSLGPEPAAAMFNKLVATMKQTHGESRIQTGVFGAMMDVALVNSGPVTVLLDSKNRQDNCPEDEGGGTPVATPSGGDTPAGTPASMASAGATAAAEDRAGAQAGPAAGSQAAAASKGGKRSAKNRPSDSLEPAASPTEDAAALQTAVASAAHPS